jgi:hypothetical protein
VIDGLHSELGRVGIRGRLRSRIVAELADHLVCDPEAGVGSPRDLAEQFANELGTSRSRVAAFGAFAALSLAGALYAASFAAMSVVAPSLGQAHARTGWLGALAVLLVLGAPQVSFAAGSLALVRALRRRRSTALPAAEVRVILRRAAVALAFGAAAMIGIALAGYEYAAELPGWVRLLDYVSAGGGVAAIGAAAFPLLAATRVAVSQGGGAGDLSDDLVPGVEPRRLALLVAALVILVVAAAGIVQSDPIDGVVRGLADGGACLAGYALLGRFLGLRARA